MCPFLNAAAPGSVGGAQRGGVFPYVFVMHDPNLAGKNTTLEWLTVNKGNVEKNTMGR